MPPITRATPTAPPKHGKPTVSSVKTGSATGSEKTRAKRTEALEGIQQTTGIILLSRKQYADAAAVGVHGDPIIREVVKLGEQVPEVGNALDYLAKAGPYTALLTACLPLAMQLAVNHDRLKPNSLMPNVVSRETMEARAKADMAKMEMMAIKLQQDAEQELRDLQDQQARANQNGFQNREETEPYHAAFSDGPH
jgi:hypothetical protein